jgi:hypothetical protein
VSNNPPKVNSPAEGLRTEEVKIGRQEEMLIDYMENDLEAPLQKDLQVLLQNSVEDRNKLKALERTKTIVRVVADIKVPNDDAFFLKIESQIMSKLDDVVPETARNNVLSFQQRRWLQVAIAACLVLVVGVGVVKLVTSSKVERQGEPVASNDLLISTSASDLDSFSDSLVNNRNDSDLIMEIAAQRIDSLSQKETASVFGRLME